MSNELVPVSQQGAIMPLMTIQEAVSRYNAVIEFTKTVMKQDKDFGTVPGTNKPTLLKPGAEKLCSMFGFAPQFHIVDKITDFDKGLFYFQYRCELYRGGNLIGSGVGSCNSRETKYRYRWQAASYKPSKEEAEKLKAQKLGKWGKNDGAWIWLERVENDEPFDVLNTIDKMAQKRALIAATLIATNASEFFTQDMEEIEVVDAVEVPDVPEQPAPAKKELPHNNVIVWTVAQRQYLIDEHLADNDFAAKGMLGMSNLPQEAAHSEIVAWGKLYRSRRSEINPETTKAYTAQQAAEWANNGGK